MQDLLLHNAAGRILVVVYTVHRETGNKPEARRWDPLSKLSAPFSHLDVNLGAGTEILLNRC